MPYICPLSQQEIQIPVMTNQGITYEFTAIAKAILLQETALDPQNNLPITSLTLNRALLNDTSISKYITPQIAQIVCALNTKIPEIKLYQFGLLPNLELYIKIYQKGKATVQAAKMGDHEKILKFLPLLETKHNVMKVIACEALIAAVSNNHIRIVQILLSNIHLKPNYTDAFYHTALSQAVSNGYIDIIHLLLTDSRVDPNLPNVFGDTPLHFAAQNGYREIVQALLLHPSIEPNECNIFDETALFVALKHNHFEIVSLLLTDHRILDYCIIKLVREPELMHNVLLSYQPLILNLLIFKNTIWSKLREASHFGLTRDEHVQLLKDILDSQYKPVKHPLYALLIASSSKSIFSTDVIYQEMQTLISHSDQQTITAFTMT